MSLIGRTSPHASSLRRNATDCERILWSVLRNRQLDGFKFRRQATVGSYVVDFLCPECGLIVEVDGGQHGDAADRARSVRLEAAGYRILRFWNHEVLGNLDGVAETVRLALGSCEKRKVPSPNPLPQAGEG